MSMVQAQKNTKRLVDRTRCTRNDQGQWLGNKKAAALLNDIKIAQPTKISLPEGLG